jgi:phosphopantothenoylcysteine synthetase/decarboxylase
VHVIGPDRGLLASGKVGLGRMAEPEAIVSEVVARLGGCPGLR